MQAVFLDYETLDKNDLDFSQLKAVFDDLILYPSTTATEVAERIQHAEVVISNKVVIDAAMLEQASNLKLILISATGSNNIDLAAAKRQGIVVCNCQGYGTAAVAQHTLALMLALATSLLKYDQAVKQGKWNHSPIFCLLDFPIVELSGKTLGIMGYGELGQAVARLARAFDMNVVVGALPGRTYDDERMAWSELLPQVDFLSLHCPLTDETRDLMDAEAFKHMKKTAFVINCARGGIVNEQALADALRSGQIAGAATDVLSVEPPKNGNVLLSDDIPNLIITPHSAWGSVDARQRIIQQLVENTQAYVQGQTIRQIN